MAQDLTPEPNPMQYHWQIEKVKGKQKEHFEEDWPIVEFRFAHFLNKFLPISQVP